MLMAFVCLFSYKLIRTTKAVMSVADVFIVIAVILVPVGYKNLGDTCPSVEDNYQCGLTCDT